MTFNGVIAPIFCIISPNYIALEADYVAVVEDRPIVYAEYLLPLLAKFDPRSSCTVSLR